MSVRSIGANTTWWLEIEVTASLITNGDHDVCTLSHNSKTILALLQGLLLSNFIGYIRRGVNEVSNTPV
jgi:hypothetical protein